MLDRLHFLFHTRTIGDGAYVIFRFYSIDLGAYTNNLDEPLEALVLILTGAKLAFARPFPYAGYRCLTP